jgi:hypothetical protein
MSPRAQWRRDSRPARDAARLAQARRPEWSPVRVLRAQVLQMRVKVQTLAQARAPTWDAAQLALARRPAVQVL